jgi:Signal transduction histidine kinase
MLALILIALSAAWASAAPRIVKLGVFQASPLVFVEKEAPKGLFIDLVEHFADEMDWRVQFVRGTWSDLLAKLERGEIDLLPAVGYTKDRTRIYDFSKNAVYIDSGVVFASRQKTIHTIFDLAGMRIAAVRGSTFTTAFSDFISAFGIKCEILLTDDNIAVMKNIADGEAGAGVCIYSLGNELAKQYPVVVTPISFSPIALEFAVPKGRNGDLIEGIDRSMARMVDDPSSAYSRSFERWTVARQPAHVPAWLWIAIAAILAIGLIMASVAIILRHEVLARTEELRKEIAQHKEAEARLERALQENQALIRELYHRTKNTLQLIRSFMDLEALELEPSPGIERIVQKTNDRIDAIALVHQMLFASRDLSRISIKGYTEGLTALFLRDLESPKGNISLELSIEDRQVLLDTAVPFGLILNELIANSIKHAFPCGRTGCIAIRLTSVDEGSFLLEYRDDGVGVPEGFDFRAQKSLGLQLLFRIVEAQLKGHISVQNAEGVRYSMRIPTGLYEARV